MFCWVGWMLEGGMAVLSEPLEDPALVLILRMNLLIFLLGERDKVPCMMGLVRTTMVSNIFKDELCLQ